MSKRVLYLTVVLLFFSLETQEYETAWGSSGEKAVSEPVPMIVLEAIRQMTMGTDKNIEITPIRDYYGVRYYGVNESGHYVETYFVDKNGRVLGESNKSLTYLQRYIRKGKYIAVIGALNKKMLDAEISIDEGYPLFTQVYYGGSAKEAGIQEGDRIVKINGQSTKGWDLDKAVRNIMGPKGTKVTLTIERKVNNKSRKLEKTVTRKAPAFAARSLIYAVIGNLAEAVKDAEVSYSIDPNDDEAKRATSLTYTLKGNPDEALKILGLGKDDFDKLLIALAYAKKGNAERAAEVYRQIPWDDLNADNVFLQDLKKMIVQSEVMKQYIEEKRRQAQLLEEKGSYLEALKEYGELIRYVDEGQIKEIRAHVARFLKEGSYPLEQDEQLRRFIVRAEFYAKEGRFVEAVNEYKRALNLAPFLPGLYKALAVNYAAVKEYKRAIDMMKIYLELCPDAGDVRAAKDEIYRWEANME